jgi:hypothetical protein
MDAIVEREWNKWDVARGYLGIGAHYSTNCPPLLFIGGDTVAPTARPLVVLSLEPLIDDRHFSQQCAFAAQSSQHSRQWQLDYFNIFPTPAMAGPRPQAYWSAMFWLIAGWSSTAPSPPPAFSWEVLASHYLEIPFIPLHAESHSPASFRPALASLGTLATERVALVRERWPNAVFLALGAVSCDHVLPALLGPGAAASSVGMPARTAVSQASFGAQLWKPVKRQILPSGEVFFSRRAPLAQGHQPKQAGIYELGRRLRAAAP